MTSVSLPFSPDAPWLAPLAGWSDLPFRLLCRELGAAVCCTEMISARGLIYGNHGTEDLLATMPQDNPLVVQLFGAEAPFMEEAVYRLLDRGFSWFDCNMGCSVPKVTRTGAGAGMCRNIDNALQAGAAMIRAAGKGRVGFKLRLGWDDTGSAANTWKILGPALAEIGAGWLTLHPRTARQGFSGTVRYQALQELKNLVSIPIIASGDLMCAEDGIRCIRTTGVDTVMYARGALRNPAVFAEHRLLWAGEKPGLPDVPTLLARIRHHAHLARALMPNRAALLKMRSIVPRYVHHMEGAKQLRLDVIACSNWDGFEAALNRFAAVHSTAV